MSISRRKFAAATASLVLMGSVGCTTMSRKDDATKKSSFLDKMPWASKDGKEAEPYPKPAKLAVTWTPDTLVQMGRTPTRGFGGRVFFYDEKSKPVPVEGTLMIHGFDDSADRPEDAVKKFAFTPEQFTRHFSQTDLGASYSIWIPWDAIGGPQRRISLVASFKTEEGHVVQGVPADIMLPGKETGSAEDKVAVYSPKFQKYQKALAADQPASSGLTVTTIPRRQGKPDATSLPSSKVSSEMFASDKTPSLEIPMAGGQNSGIMPVSASQRVKR